MAKLTGFKVCYFVVFFAASILMLIGYWRVFIRVVYGHVIDGKSKSKPSYRCPSNGVHGPLGHACGRIFDKFPYTYQYKTGSKDDCERTILLSDRDLPLTALASYPGSGNTWVRYLIQQATGVATGSVYCDLNLKRNGFFADGVRNSSVVAIKTHVPFSKHMYCFDQAILLVRNPRDSVLSYFNWAFLHSHLDQTSQQTFSTQWPPFWKKKSEKWRKFHTQWLNFSRRMIVVHYECLKSHLDEELTRIVEFLGFKIPQEKMKCLLENNRGQFLRHKNATVSARRQNDLREMLPDQMIQRMYSDILHSPKLLNYTQEHLHTLHQFLNTECKYS